MKFYTSFFKSKNRLFVRGYDDSSKQQFFEQHDLVDCVVYEETTAEENDTSTNQQRTIYGTPLVPHEFNTAYQASKFIKENGEFKKLWGYPRYEYALIDKLFSSDYNSALFRTCFFDIETFVGDDNDTGQPLESSFPDIFNAQHPVSLITCCVNKKITVLSLLTTFDKAEVIKHVSSHISDFSSYDLEIFTFTDERKLLSEFIKYISTNKPDILTGWNTNGFDLPYLHARISALLGENAVLRLSPFNIVTVREYKNDFGNDALSVSIKGIECLDYLDLYKKFELSPRENYKLETIADIETGAGKLDYEGTFKDFYTFHQNRFIAYNIIDVIKVIDIDRAVGFIDVAAAVSYSAKCVMTDVFPVTKIWDNIIANYLDSKNIQVPADFHFQKENFEGAFVKAPMPGFYRWLVSYDVGSLYPSLIMQNNIGPETLLDETVDITPYDVTNRTEKLTKALKKAKELNASLSANGALFSNDKKSFLSELVEIFIERRVSNKKEMKQWAKFVEHAKTRKTSLCV